MRISRKPRSLSINGFQIRLRRTTGGVAEVWADDELALAAGQGYMHAHDRLSQMMLWRLVGQGRSCECLKNGAEQLQMDIHFRNLGLAYYARQEWEQCTPQAREFAEAYCQGINH